MSYKSKFQEKQKTHGIARFYAISWGIKKVEHRGFEPL